MSKAITENDLYKLKTLSQPVASKEYYFLTQTYCDKDSNEYRSNILAFSKDGKYVGNFDNDNFASKSPVVGKDYLFFLSKEDSDSQYQVFKVRLSGGTAQKVTALKHSVEKLLVPKGTNNVFFKTRETNEVPKKPYEKFPTVRHVFRVSHKEDGFGFLPTDGKYDLYRYDGDTEKTSLLYSSPVDFDLSDVSHKSEKIVLTRTNKPDDDLDFGQGVYVLNVDTGKLFNITSDHPDWAFSSAKFSPDDTQLLLVGHSNKYMANTQNQVYGWNFETKEFTDYTQGLDEEVDDFYAADFTQNENDDDIFWVNNDQFVFRTSYHGRSKLYLYKDKQVEEFFNERERLTDWSVDQDRLLAVYTTGDHPTEFATIDFEGNQTDLFNPNQKFDSEHEYASLDRFVYKASDGLPIEGWVMEPLHQKRTNPVVLYVHGGPHFAYGESFFFEMQVHAANGYGVVLINPRGSTSYGQDFCLESVGHYGQKDYTDLMEGMDYVLANHPEFDKNHQYVAGGSYGGFMTTWTVGHNDRFAAAVAQRPVTDWVSFAGTSDIGYMFVPQEMQTNRYDVDKLWKFSPLAYAENVKTPTLIMQGEWDTRCPIGQGEEFFSALVENGVEAQMSRYPQSWHGVSRNGLPNLRVDRIKETRSWWDKHQ